MRVIETVGVVGGGLMGAGIAQVAAEAGYPTTCREVSEGECARARLSVEMSMERAIERGKLATAARDQVLEKLTMTTQLDAVAACDIVIEAIVEDRAAKTELWMELDQLAAPATIFASNTSSLSIVEMAAATSRGDRFVGMHFFNPVPQMKLVEVVRSIATSDDTFEMAIALARGFGKEPIRAKDTPGFVVNLLLVPYMLDAIRALEHGVASVHDIDTGMKLGAGHPMGPLALCDLVGLDTLERVAEVMYDAYRETRYAPPALLRRLVLGGMLGKKNGRGFYEYAGGPPVPNTKL
jgi:3-hydroxybutyryl-CoA dehydrogenase